jgi:hypothetical protein
MQFRCTTDQKIWKSDNDSPRRLLAFNSSCKLRNFVPYRLNGDCSAQFLNERATTFAVGF